MSSVSIPFTFKKVYGGFGHASGLVRVEESGLVIEYRVIDSLFQVMKSPVKTLYVPFADLALVELRKNAFSTRLHIRANTMAVLQDFPGEDNGCVDLELKRQDRPQASRFLAAVQIMASDYEMRMPDHGPPLQP